MQSFVFPRIIRKTSFYHRLQVYSKLCGRMKFFLNLVRLRFPYFKVQYCSFLLSNALWWKLVTFIAQVNHHKCSFLAQLLYMHATDKQRIKQSTNLRQRFFHLNSEPWSLWLQWIMYELGIFICSWSIWCHHHFKYYKTSHNKVTIRSMQPRLSLASNAAPIMGHCSHSAITPYSVYRNLLNSRISQIGNRSSWVWRARRCVGKSICWPQHNEQSMSRLFKFIRQWHKLENYRAVAGFLKRCGSQ
jgi:hypothetical protein